MFMTSLQNRRQQSSGNRGNRGDKNLLTKTEKSFILDESIRFIDEDDGPTLREFQRPYGQPGQMPIVRNHI